MYNTVTVRWWDGYMETFECTEVRFGCDLLWMRLADGKNRHIPMNRAVRTERREGERAVQKNPLGKSKGIMELMRSRPMWVCGI